MYDQREGPESRYGFGSFLLEPQTRRLVCRGTPVALGPGLFDLLWLLAREQGRVVPRARIVEALWPEVVVSDTALRQKVWLLRGLLRAADPAGPEWLETVPRRGYRLAASAACEPEAWEPEAWEPRPQEARADTRAVPAGRKWIPPVGSWTPRAPAVSLRLLALPLVLALLVCSPHGAMPRVADTPVVAPRNAGQSITLLRLTSRSTGADDSWLATAFTELLRAELAAVKGLHLVPAPAAERVAAQLSPPPGFRLSPDSLAWLRGALGTDVVVAGSVAVTGAGPDAHLRVDLLIQCTRSRSVVAAVTRSGSRHELPQLASRTARELRRALGTRAATRWSSS